MSSRQEIYDRFLKKFTEEILLRVKFELDSQEANIFEEKRIEQEVQAEKLKIRFSGYSEEQKIKRDSQNQPNTPKPIAKPLIQKPVEQKIKIPIQNIPIKPGEINFGKLMTLVNDPSVSYIDCAGENKDITIRKAGRIMKVDLTLNKEEIDSIIKSFSEKARIPLIEGMLKARFNSLEIAAVFSANGSSFVLKRNLNQISPISQGIQFRPRYPLPQNPSLAKI